MSVGGHEPGTAGLADARRLAALAETGLGPTADPAMDEVAEQVRRLLRAPVALVSLVSADGQALPGLAGLGEPWASCRSTPPSHSFCQHVVTGARPLAVADARLDPRLERNRAIPDLGVVAYAGVPLLDAAGLVLGSLCAIDIEPRRWTEAELDLLAVLGQGCSARLQVLIAERDANRERVRTDAAGKSLRQAFQRSQLLLAASQALARTNDVDEIRSVVTDLVSGDIAPAYVGLSLTQGGKRLVRVDDPDQSVGPEPVDAVTTLDAQLPTALAIRERALQVFGDEDELAAAFPEDIQRAYRAVGLRSLACAPLSGAEGVIGALMFGWAGRRALDPIERVVLTTLADYVAHAVERTRFLQRRITVAHQLQDAMLTDLPTVPGLRLAARYWPASDDDKVGGDWFDAIPLLDLRTPSATCGDALAVSVGDITGHDTHAAAVMGQVRSMARQATWERPDGPPSTIVAAVERACAAVGTGASGTLIHAHLRPLPTGSWAMRWTNTGHPPLIVARATGAVEVIHSRDLMFGYPEFRKAPLRDHHAELAPGDTLLLYTDGLVERRRLDIDDEIATAARAVAAAPKTDLHTLLDDLHEHLVGEVRDDDVVLLIVHIDP
ncbi:SpoIIE family protein phosphatase [Actinokineospora pegani]|uniref:SpoIIE family protein phosphatase n=1 Tax=Actinokineospora pegani TaxID=2654637 RepID=UPI0012EAE3FB|nr:SpoIIE family protein phosphatase [Actinokineospora pegani]